MIKKNNNFNFPSMLFVLSLILFPFSISAFNLQVEESYDIPGLTDPIVALDFNTGNDNGNLRIAATDGSNIVVYSTNTDELIFSTTIDPNYNITHIIFDDVNRDHVPDIVVGAETRCYYEDFICSTMVQIYDGAVNFQSVDYNIYTSHTSLLSSIHTDLRMLESLDWDRDGYNELLISVDSLLVAYYPVYGNIFEEIVGKTYFYNSFPDSLLDLDLNKYLISKPIQLPFNMGSNTMIATRHRGYYTDIGDDVKDIEHTGVLINNAGLISELASKAQPDFCGIGYREYVDNFSPQCLISLGGEDLIPSIISTYNWSQFCVGGISEPEFWDSSGSEITMHQIISVDSTEEIWTVPNNGYYDLVYDTSFPGYFFGISSGDNNAVQFYGIDGSIHDESQSLGPGMKFWDDPYYNGSTKLIVIENNNVKIYGHDFVTDIADDTDEHMLPANFTLLQPFPNPFNATLSIPLKLNKKAHTTIEAFNLLGRKVEIIYEDNLQQGEHNISWNANKFSSGIYLIKVTVDNQAKSAKAVLLK